MTLPTQTILNNLLVYDRFTGKLHWRSRRLKAFPDIRSCNTWNTRYAGKEAFTAVDRKGYRVGAIFGINYRASRVIFKLMTGEDAYQVDHENGDRSDNRWKNLRDVTHQQNQQNMKRASNNTSGTTGVCWSKAKERWEAKIKVNQKTIHLGRFKELNDAITARKEAEILHGFHPNHGR